MIKAEILSNANTRGRGILILDAMKDTATEFGILPKVRREYVGDCELLLMWGAGEPARNRICRDHVTRGGRVICFDMGYFNGRASHITDSMNRISIDGTQPAKKWFGRIAFDSTRFDQLRINTKRLWCPKGDVVLVGLGQKSCEQFGIQPGSWERKKLAQIERALPNVSIRYRPKPNTAPPFDYHNADLRPDIESVLDGAALVVCRHSNVAIDAIKFGIPVSTEEGAAASLYSDTIEMKSPVSESKQMAFLRELANWQYSIAEIYQGKAWQFLSRIGAVKCD